MRRKQDETCTPRRERNPGKSASQWGDQLGQRRNLRGLEQNTNLCGTVKMKRVLHKESALLPSCSHLCAGTGTPALDIRLREREMVLATWKKTWVGCTETGWRDQSLERAHLRVQIAQIWMGWRPGTIDWGSSKEGAGSSPAAFFPAGALRLQNTASSSSRKHAKAMA